MKKYMHFVRKIRDLLTFMLLIERNMKIFIENFVVL